VRTLHNLEMGWVWKDRKAEMENAARAAWICFSDIFVGGKGVARWDEGRVVYFWARGGGVWSKREQSGAYCRIMITIWAIWAISNFVPK